MQDLIAALVSFFLIEPLQAEMADKLAAARAPQAIVAEVTACARDAAPLHRRARDLRPLVGRLKRVPGLDRDSTSRGPACRSRTGLRRRHPGCPAVPDWGRGMTSLARALAISSVTPKTVTGAAPTRGRGAITRRVLAAAALSRGDSVTFS